MAAPAPTSAQRHHVHPWAWRPQHDEEDDQLPDNDSWILRAGHVRFRRRSTTRQRSVCGTSTTSLVHHAADGAGPLTGLTAWRARDALRSGGESPDDPDWRWPQEYSVDKCNQTGEADHHQVRCLTGDRHRDRHRQERDREQEHEDKHRYGD